MRTINVSIIWVLFAIPLGCGERENLESYYMASSGSGDNEYGDEECYDHSDCLPDNPDSCKSYWCDENYECQSGPLCPGDDNPCTVNERCENGACLSDPKCEPDDLTCTADWCDSETGQCMHEHYDPIEPTCTCDPTPKDDPVSEFAYAVGKYLELPVIKWKIGGKVDVKGSGSATGATCANGCASSLAASASGSFDVSVKDSVSGEIEGEFGSGTQYCMECNEGNCEFECTSPQCTTQSLGFTGSLTHTKYIGGTKFTFPKSGPVRITAKCGATADFTASVGGSGSRTLRGSCEPSCEECKTVGGSVGGGISASAHCAFTVKAWKYTKTVGCKDCAQIYGNSSLSASYKFGECEGEDCYSLTGTAGVKAAAGGCVPMYWFSAFVNFGFTAEGTATLNSCGPDTREGDLDGWWSVSASCPKKCMCCDGEPSPSCEPGRDNYRGCCSHHGGICDGRCM